MTKDEFTDLVGIEYADEYEKAQLSQERTTKGTTFSCSHENDTISRQAAIEEVYERAIGNISWADREDCKKLLEELPSVQPERKTGHWIAPKYYPTQFTFTCSKCGYKQSFNRKFKFCPNCGADMRGVQDD